MAAPLFFSASRSAFRQVTELFDFVWPTAAALWNLRWQVTGFVTVRGATKSEHLASRFIEGSGIHGANIKRACIEMTWEQQQGQFSKFLLINLFAVYEGWLAELLTGKVPAKVIKQCQFPPQASRPTEGISWALGEIKGTTSTLISQELYPELVKHPKNSLGQISNLLQCYRCFKECSKPTSHTTMASPVRKPRTLMQPTILFPRQCSASMSGRNVYPLQLANPCYSHSAEWWASLM